ncbi:putative tRNA-splicing endonuclease [Aspergillus clavatus NRRL 1]|uniref:tRNA-splicing endonuclease, putative n=1 Tax=Aspergillus clavatus (strain ATCC 1007 / CBS 513.65 / DSM 816 / NCTC 3887 / NRRL 1 / QM 1276 / 107) TaxID=344612 RepID=A1CMW9_ASPCL|nr:tRNA-splicing endonuclease, putative [Aspergillus clavatus NRRL 1]EAW08906.1 tRNA-splicing endonuclease, putative [Aspergillus clavatus NRRL 1]
MEFMDIVGELRALPDNVHILCPRQHDDDHARYDDPNEVDEAGRSVAELVAEATSRREKFLSCMRILAYNQEGVEELQTWIWRKLDDALEKCDLCIKQYYTGKIWLIEQLKENYDDEDIEKFARMLDEWDIKRITKHLAVATAKLKSIAPQEIGLHVLDRASLLSIFETLSCEAMLRNNALLQEHFDEPFRLIQTKRSLKVSDYVPAVTRFLFDPNQNRSFWAIHSWMRYSRPPTATEFDWAIKEGLLEVLKAASQQPPQIAVIQRLWRGMQLVVKRLDKDQITHHLRALEIDPCRLSVEHLGIQSPALRFLLNTIQIFLEKSPGDFWDAMQTISPQAIIELVFYNPQLEAFMMQITEGEPYEKSPLKDMLSWVSPFMSSLKGAHQPSACRSLVYQLLDRLQDPRFPNLARYHCFHVGLTSLLQTLRSFTDNEASRGSVARIVLSETMGVVSANIETILKPPQFAVEQRRQEEIASLCMDVVRNTLALECQSLKSDYEVILRQNTLQHGVSTYSAPIWEAVVRSLHEDNLPLSTSALLGILPLVGLEKFPVKGESNPEKTNFNEIYGHLTRLSCQIIERLADFKPEHLNELFKSQDTSSALISALFAADLDTYQAAVDLIKNMSGQSARRDAISHLLQSFFTTTMYGLSWSFRRISNMKTFASAPRMLHTGTDIVDILCDSQTGILRTRKLADRREILSLQKLWEYLWQALTTIFDETESWHLRGNDKAVMLEFCRDTIQFADLLFDQCGVFLSAVVDADPNQEASGQENFLKSPTTTMSAMVKWLRLKDEYLATTLVGLVAKLLRRLGELSVTTVKDDALNFIEGVAVKSTIKTILTLREKAELVRALEAYYKKPVVTASTASLKKQSMITAFAKPAGVSATPSPAKISDDEFDEDNVPDDVLMQLSRSVELNKQRLATEAKRKAEKAAKALPAIPKPAPAPLKSNVTVQSFREKREKEKEAKRKRDLAELARLKKNLPARGVAEQTAEQGSGLSGLGVKGKVHTTEESMMVSSGSESESESEDELDKELFGAKARSKPDAVKAYEESKKLSLKQQGPVKKIKQVRSAKDMRARLAPDLSSLHRTILGWDFFANGDLPPNSGRTDYSLVSNTFRDPIEYQKTFEPLLILEAWQGFNSAKEEGTFRPFEIKVATRLSVDSFVEVSTILPSMEAKDYGIGEADIILLSKSSRPTSDSSAPHCLARIASVNRKRGTVEVSYRVNPGNPFINSLAPGAMIWGAKITSLTPLEREYGALMALQYYDLCEEVIRAKPSPILKYSDATLKPIAENYNVNPAQAKAIKSALDNDAFTLIQGPPGSGKTKTIVALVGALLSNVLGNQGVAISRPTGVTNSRPPVRTTTSKKLLICAPSNAAVDELVMRFKEGVKTIQGRQEKLSVIRLGRSDAINTNVLDVTLDELVNARLSQNPRKDGGERDLQKIYMEHKAADTAFKETRAKIDQCRAQGLPVPEELSREFDLMKKKKTQLSQEIDTARDRNHSAARDADLNRRRIQQEIIEGAHIICATLSGSGHEMFQNLSIEFETVIIDEAAQSIELSALIPLKYGCSKCILVGDPKQLPPTVLSKVASKFQYEQSLFVRMQANHPRDVHLLDTQYRMHPEISAYPSAAFYDGKLRDGPNMAQLRARPWHQSELLSPYRFFDVQGLHQNTTKGHSLINLAELRVAMQLYERITTDFRDYDFSGKIGIITPYKGQLRELKTQFAARYGNSIFNKVDFNTTDAFQGRESEIIIFSCVRASNKGIGFLSDIRRMNVGLTRAKSSLWVLGNSQSLVQGEFWNGLIKDSRRRNVYTSGDILEILQRPQFTGYKNVDMMDAEPPQPTVSPQTIAVQSTSRPSSASLERSTPESSHLVPASSKATPPEPLPDKPSGGANGLDETRTCGYCGSFAHMTPNCDNIDAKEASQGKCFRCGSSGHTRRDCTTERCLQCGAFGHVTHDCQSSKELPKREKTRIAREEYHHAQMKKQRTERQRQKQLGGHDPKVPVLQISDPLMPEKKAEQSKPVHNNGPVKRKRMDSASSDPAKVSRPRVSDPLIANAPKGPRRKIDTNIPTNAEGLVKPSRDGPAFASIGQNKPSDGVQPGAGSANPTPRPPPPRPGQQGARPPPPMRRKKEVDPFIRPKRR